MLEGVKMLEGKVRATPQCERASDSIKLGSMLC